MIKKGETISEEHKMKISEANRKRWMQWRVKRAEVIAEQLEQNGVMNIRDIKGYSPSFIMRFPDKFLLIHIKWRGGRGKSAIKGIYTYIKHDFVGKKLLGIKDNRTAIVRFFMGIFRDDKLYDRNDAKAINQWLKHYGLSRAERVSIITKLGYKYKQLKHIMINGYLDHRARKKR